jgi:pimeloyl-ACP methyl ester carboxylesterase
MSATRGGGTGRPRTSLSEESGTLDASHINRKRAPAAAHAPSALAYTVDDPPPPRRSSNAADQRRRVHHRSGSAVQLDEPAGGGGVRPRACDTHRRQHRLDEQPLPARPGDNSAREQPAGITAPTLVVHGTEDPLFPIAHGADLAGDIPGARLLTS